VQVAKARLHALTLERNTKLSYGDPEAHLFQFRRGDNLPPSTMLGGQAEQETPAASLNGFCF
jgi:hypothetical protein